MSSPSRISRLAMAPSSKANTDGSKTSVKTIYRLTEVRNLRDSCREMLATRVESVEALEGNNKYRPESVKARNMENMFVRTVKSDCQAGDGVGGSPIQRLALQGAHCLVVYTDTVDGGSNYESGQTAELEVTQDVESAEETSRQLGMSVILLRRNQNNDSWELDVIREHAAWTHDEDDRPGKTSTRTTWTLPDIHSQDPTVRYMGKKRVNEVDVKREAVSIIRAADKQGEMDGLGLKCFAMSQTGHDWSVASARNPATEGNTGASSTIATNEKSKEEPDVENITESNATAVSNITEGPGESLSENQSGTTASKRRMRLHLPAPRLGSSNKGGPNYANPIID